MPGASRSSDRAEDAAGRVSTGAAGDQHEGDDARRPCRGCSNCEIVPRCTSTSPWRRCTVAPSILHVDLARHHDRIVDGFGAMIARRPRPARIRRCGTPNRWDRCSRHCGRRRRARSNCRSENEPVDQMTQPSCRGPPRDHVAADLIHGHDGAAGIVMAGDDASDVQRPCW